MDMQTDPHASWKSKRSKRWKKEVKDEVVEGIGENQPDWLDTLKEEIANLK
jgi:hypothetical protein